MSRQTRDTALWEDRPETLHYGQTDQRHCTMSRQTRDTALWADRPETLHYGQTDLRHLKTDRRLFTADVAAVYLYRQTKTLNDRQDTLHY